MIHNSWSERVEPGRALSLLTDTPLPCRQALTWKSETPDPPRWDKAKLMARPAPSQHLNHLRTCSLGLETKRQLSA